MSTSPDITALKTAVMRNHRLKGEKHPDTIAAHRDLAAAVAEKRLQEIVDAAPPFTPAQRMRLSTLING